MNVIKQVKEQIEKEFNFKEIIFERISEMKT